MTLFEHLPDDSHCWLYAASHSLTEAEVRSLLTALEPFQDAWTTHGRRVQSGATVVDNRLLVLAAHVPDGDMSGCGIDKSLHALDAFAAQAGFSWVSGLMVVYRTPSGALETVSRAAFADMAVRGTVDAQTPVVDLSVRSLGDLREHGVERSAGTSWHAKYIAQAHSVSS
ncbi:MAG: hypothetical protein RIE53_02895 [Rhodothermales bacterium]